MKPRAWIDALLDPGSWLALQSEASDGYAYGPEVVAGLGEVQGRPVALYAIDPGCDKGFVTARGAWKIRRLMDRAEDLGVPIVAFLASAGVSVAEGLASGDAYTRVITGNIRMSGVVPQIAAVMGVTMGAPAYSATLMDLVLFNRTRSHLMVTGPAVVQRMLGEAPTLAALGGAEVHADRTGIADFVDASPAAQVERVKVLLSLLPSNHIEDPPERAPEPPAKPFPAIPERPEVAFDVTEVLDGLLDASRWVEVGDRIGGAIVTAFGYLEGLPVGVVANQSLVGSGAIDADAARKAARFIRLCDAYGVPIVNLIDVPGFMPGVEEERKGLLRHGAHLCTAMYTSVPRLSVVLRKCYGAAAFVMLQTKSQDGDVVLALEGSRIAVMGFEAARHVVYGDAEDTEDVLRERYRREYETPERAYREGLIDEMVAPNGLRARLAAHLRWLRRKRERPPIRRRHPVER